MSVRLTPGTNPYQSGIGTEITDEKEINVVLRDTNNLIQLTQNNELYTDLQLANGLKPTDTIPVGRTVGRVLANDGWIRTGTLVCEKTTSGDIVQILYADDGTIWINRGSGFEEITCDRHRDIIATTYPSDYYHYEYDELDGYDVKIKIGKFKTVDGENITQLRKGDIVSFINMDADPNNSKKGTEEKKGGGAKITPHGMDNRISIYSNDADPEDPDTPPLQVIYLAPFYGLGTMPQEMQDEYDDPDLTLHTNAVIQTGEVREGISPITGEKCLVYMMWNCGRTYVLDGSNPPRE